MNTVTALVYYQDRFHFINGYIRVEIVDEDGEYIHSFVLYIKREKHELLKLAIEHVRFIDYGLCVARYPKGFEIEWQIEKQDANQVTEPAPPIIPPWEETWSKM